MIGEARRLAVDVALPGEVGLRVVTSEPDVRAMCAMQAEVFGDPDAGEAANAVLCRLATGDGMQLWVAEADGQIVGAGGLEPAAGTEFAGIWGGATRPEWRSRGIYRALTAARARSALALGKRLMHSDSTELSAHPGAGGAGQGLCYDALHVAPVRISGRPDVSAETSHAIAWRSGLAAAMALPRTVAVGCRPAGQASTMACLPPQPGRQDAEQTRSQLDRRLDGQTVGRVGVLPSNGARVPRALSGWLFPGKVVRKPGPG